MIFVFALYFQAFAKQFLMAPDDLDMQVIYDVSHNIAKVEEHIVDGKPKTLLVHRKVSDIKFPDNLKSCIFYKNLCTLINRILASLSNIS